jgi:glycosyltransferase involved in cell wall biosynthesis
LPAVWVAKLSRKQFLLRVPGDYAWEQAQLRFKVEDRLHDFIDKRMEYGFFVSMLCRVESYVAKQAVRVVVPSKYLKTIVEKWGVSTNKIQVIHSALHPIEVTETKDNLRAKFNYSYPTIVSAGRLVPNKGFTGLLKVFANLLHHHPQAKLIIIGDGPQKPELENLINQHKLTDSVKLTGNLTSDALGAVIRTADVFALNTAHEGLSHQLIEVMDLGTPIVTTNVGGNPELITDGVHGFLVEYGNLDEFEEALLQVLNHPESQARMTQSARGRSKDFRKEVVIGQLVELLNKL